MSMAPREAKCSIVCTICSGQERFGQRICTSPSGWTTGVPQTGQCVGIVNATSAPVRSWISGATTCGMTSPARWTTTRSPTRRSLRAMSSWLCNVARLTVTPPTATGSMTAYGTRAPVRPTFTRISRR